MKRRSVISEGFWARFADELSWFRKWDSVLEWDPPHAKWFVGAKTNVSYNCVDRHLADSAQQGGHRVGG